MRKTKMTTLLSLACAVTLSAGVGVVVMNNIPVAKAETAHTEAVFMANGASIRYSDPSGIRFTGYVKDDGDLSDNVVGIKIKVGDNEIDCSTATATSEWKWSESEYDGYKKFHVALTGIPASEYETEMTAQAYIDGETSSEIVTRSIANVAVAALAEDTLEGKLLDANVTKLEEYVNDTAVVLPFDTTTVSVENGNLVFDAVENAKGYLVQFGEEVRNVRATEFATYSIPVGDFEGIIKMLPYGDGIAYRYAEKACEVYAGSNQIASFNRSSSESMISTLPSGEYGSVGDSRVSKVAFMDTATCEGSKGGALDIKMKLVKGVWRVDFKVNFESAIDCTGKLGIKVRLKVYEASLWNLTDENSLFLKMIDSGGSLYTNKSDERFVKDVWATGEWVTVYFTAENVAKSLTNDGKTLAFQIGVKGPFDYTASVDGTGTCGIYLDDISYYAETPWTDLAAQIVYSEENEMELGAYIAPSASFLDVYLGANFTKYTIVISENLMTQEKLVGILNKCEETGVDAQIQLHSGLLKKGYNVFTEAYSGIDFKDYPCVKSFFITDEPSWKDVEIIDEVYVPWYNENYANSDIEFYVNLFGGYSSGIGPVRDANGNVLLKPNGEKYYNDATAEQKEGFYKTYVEKWLKVFKKVNSKIKYFTIDCYPFGDNQPGKLVVADVKDSTDENAITAEQLYAQLAERIGEDYVLRELPDGYERHINASWLYENYLAANNAKNNSMTFGAYIQSFDEGGAGDTHSKRTYRLPTTLAEIKWQAYMNIAFGAKKLVYYGYDWTKNGTYMAENGKPTPLYTLVQQTNEELLKVDHVFKAFDTWVGVKTFLGSGSSQNTAFEKIADIELKKLTGVSSVASSRDLVVGEMVDGDGNRGYMLVGYDDPFYGRQTEVTMKFDGAKGLIVYRNGQRSLSDDLKNGIFTVTLEAGEGVFVIPVY